MLILLVQPLFFSVFVLYKFAGSKNRQTLGNLVFISYLCRKFARWTRRSYISTSTSTSARVNKRRTSTGQVQDKLHTDNPNIVKLVQIIGEQELSVKEMMDGVGLKGRDNFLNLYLNPAVADGYIRLLFPQSPRHPRQKYLLTVKGLALYNDINRLP